MTQSIVIGQSCFHNDESQNYFISQLLHFSLKRIGNTEKFVLWKSKELSDEKVTSPTNTDNSLFPSINWYENSKLFLIFKGSCLKQKKCKLYSS